MTTTEFLKGLSWQEIYKLYRAYGQELQEYNNVANRIGIVSVSPDISRTDAENIFILRFKNEVKQLDMMVRGLDGEIARRNSLIGVVG